ncbi:hypothetical protein BPIT_31170 [Candidatus Brocadia pituitae]|nr:hypothetical protein BPIT_31170 [Candidatus Brocadia pituitae]
MQWVQVVGLGNIFMKGKIFICVYLLSQGEMSQARDAVVAYKEMTPITIAVRLNNEKSDNSSLSKVRSWQSHAKRLFSYP